MTAIAAPTSANEAPAAFAVPSTIPSAPDNDAASRFPSRIVFTRMSVAIAAVRPASAQVFIALTVASATVFVSPSPAAEALADIVRASSASCPRIPAEVMKNMASESSTGPRPMAGPNASIESFQLSTCSCAIPTRPTIV